MRLQQTHTIGDIKVHLDLSSLFEHDDRLVFQFGNRILGGGQNYGNVKVLPNEYIEIQTDFFAGQRIYYWEEGPKLYITDNIFKFLDESDLKNEPLDEFESEYFKKHGYTSGDSTMYKRIKKIPPASLFTIDKNGLKIKSKWNLYNVKEDADSRKFSESLLKSVQKQLEILNNTPEKVLLCFSGGKDSTYLAHILKDLGIDFNLVFFRDKNLKINNKEAKRAMTSAQKLGKTIEYIDITGLKDDTIEEAIQRFNFFDKHYCRYHFYGLKEIKRIYGENVIMVNGQNADSILSFGPSEEKIGSWIKRYLLYGDNLTLKRCFASVIGMLFRKKLIVPTSLSTRQNAFYDNFKYCLLLDSSTEDYNIKVSDKVSELMSSLPEDIIEREAMMYLKAMSHMQASDAQVVTQSAKYHGLGLLMPLAPSDIMRLTLKYKDDKRELYHPKYALNSKLCRKS